MVGIDRHGMEPVRQAKGSFHTGLLRQHEEFDFRPKWDGEPPGFKIRGRHDLIYVLKQLLWFC